MAILRWCCLLIHRKTSINSLSPSHSLIQYFSFRVTQTKGYSWHASLWQQPPVCWWLCWCSLPVEEKERRKFHFWAFRSGLKIKNQLMAEECSCVPRETVSFSVSLEPYWATLTTAAQLPLNTNEVQLKEGLTGSMT